MDDRLRRLERAWKETGSAAAERAFRLAQLRAGDLRAVDLPALCVRQVLIQPTGQLGKGPDPRSVLEELADADPLLAIRRSVQKEPVWSHQARRVPWAWTLAAPSDALLEETLGRLRDRTQRELDVSSPAPVFPFRVLGEIDYVQRTWRGQPGDRVYLTFEPSDDLSGFQVEAEGHDPEDVADVREAVELALRAQVAPWLPAAGFAVGFEHSDPPRRWRRFFRLVREALWEFLEGVQADGRVEVLEPWVRVTATGEAAAQAIHALAKEGGWADGGAGDTHHGVIALRRLPRARKRIEQQGCGVSWVYERHEPAHETREQIESLLTDLGWNLTGLAPSKD